MLKYTRKSLDVMGARIGQLIGKKVYVEYNHIGYDFLLVVNDTGGAQSLIGNNGPGGNPRKSIREMGSFLEGMLAGLQHKS